MNDKPKQPNKPNRPKVIQGVSSRLKEAGKATSSEGRKPSRWRKANFFQRLDLVMGGTALTSGLAYGVFLVGQHVALLSTASALLTPFAQMLLGIMAISLTVSVFSALLQTWRKSDKEADENMAAYKDQAEEGPAPVTGGAEFNPGGAAVQT